MGLKRGIGRAGIGVTAAVALSGVTAIAQPTSPQPTRPVLASTGLASTGLASTGLASTGLASTGLASTGLAELAVARTGVTVRPQVTVPSAHPSAQLPGGYTPAQLRAAYYVNPLLRSGINGKGISIAIVDSFGSPTIRSDLAVFDHEFRLKTPQLSIIHPAGAIPRFSSSNSTMDDWADETTLDVEWAHAMAPDAKIVLVETPTSENEGTSGFPQILNAEEYVIAHHLAGVISQSFGATEETFPKGAVRPLRGAYIEAAQPAHDITVLAASGDAGASDLRTNESLYYTYPVTEWPASDPLVTAVGGLDLRLDALGRRTAPDQVWNDPGPPPSAGGGGKSTIFGRPSYQNGVATVVGNHRGVPDVSMSASCSHPVDIYESFDGSGWDLICGTSEATPLLAGVIALANQVAGRPLGPINSYLYKMAAEQDPGITDITHGNNSVLVSQNGKQYTVKGWNAVPGYDLASGVGTIVAKYFVPELAALAKKSGT
jgi:subtilase family serine protease